MSTVWILIWVSTYLIVLTGFIAKSQSLHDTIMVENDAYSEILNYDGNNGMEIALVTGLMICLTGIGLYGTEFWPTGPSNPI